MLLESDERISLIYFQQNMVSPCAAFSSLWNWTCQALHFQWEWTDSSDTPLTSPALAIDLAKHSSTCLTANQSPSYTAGEEETAGCRSFLEHIKKKVALLPSTSSN